MLPEDSLRPGPSGQCHSAHIVILLAGKAHNSGGQLVIPPLRWANTELALEPENSNHGIATKLIRQSIGQGRKRGFDITSLIAMS